VNDLVVSGAEPRYLSLALIIEEELPVDDPQKILNSIKNATKEAGVIITTGDTKVVRRG
jgi:hydrogenase expression/formation protein HypE